MKKIILITLIFAFNYALSQDKILTADQKSEIISKADLGFASKWRRYKNNISFDYRAAVYDSDLNKSFYLVRIKNHSPFNVNLDKFTASLELNKKEVLTKIKDIEIENVFSFDSFLLKNKESSEFVLMMDPLNINENQRLVISVQTDQGEADNELSPSFVSGQYVTSFEEIAQRYYKLLSKGKTTELKLVY